MTKANQLCRHLTLTYKHADAHAAPGDDAGDLQCSATLRAHQTVPRPQAALWTAAPRAFTLCFLDSLWLSLPCVRVLFIPLLTLTFSHVVF